MEPIAGKLTYTIILLADPCVQRASTQDLGEEEAPVAAAALRTWPHELPGQAAALSAVLGTLTAPADVATIAGHFEGKKTKKRLEEVTRLLETLAALGRARFGADGWTYI